MARIPQRQAADSDEGRLPWLASNPPAAAQPVARRTGGSGMRWFIALLILALVAAGAFVLGRGSDSSKLIPPPVAVSLPPARLQVPPVEASEALALGESVAKTPPALARVAEAPPLPAKIARVATVPAQPSGGLHLSNEQIRAVRKIVREARVSDHRAQPPVAAFSPKVAPPGRVVQLGAYGSVRQAEAAAQLFRYKYRGLLESLPIAVLPFRPKGSRKTFYRVQFVTPSQAYSEVTCQRLRAAAKTCTVIY